MQVSKNFYVNINRIKSIKLESRDIIHQGVKRVCMTYVIQVEENSKKERLYSIDELSEFWGSTVIFMTKYVLNNY